jgi:hypothetical protein
MNEQSDERNEPSFPRLMLVAGFLQLVLGLLFFGLLRYPIGTLSNLGDEWLLGVLSYSHGGVKSYPSLEIMLCVLFGFFLTKNGWSLTAKRGVKSIFSGTECVVVGAYTLAAYFFTTDLLYWPKVSMDHALLGVSFMLVGVIQIKCRTQYELWCASRRDG